MTSLFRRNIYKIILGVSLIFIFLFFLHPVQGDGDIFHHLNTGKYIFEHGQLPQVDEWTFTAQGRSWVANAWGTGVIYYLLYTTFGPTSISIFMALQAVFLFALLYLLLQSYDINKQTSLLPLIFGFTVISTRWPNRPELITYPFIACILLVYRLKGRYPRIVSLLPVLVCVWSILYAGSVFIGLILLFIILLIQFFRDRFIVKHSNISFYISVLITFPISLLNGYGFKSLLYILLIPTISKIQGEWQGLITVLREIPLDQLIQIQYEVLLFLIYLLVVVLLALYKRKVLIKYPLESLLGFGLLTPFFAFRNIPLAILLSLPLFAILFSQLNMKAKKIVFVVLICVTLFSIIISLRMNKHGIGEDKTSYSENIVKFFHNNKLSGNVFTNQQTGSYISYHLYPSVLVYSDTRDDLFVNTPILSDFQNTFSTGKNVIPLLNKYRSDIVLADRIDGKSYQPLLYSKDWSLVYVDDRYLLFVKNKIAQNKKLFEYTAIDPFSNTKAKKGLEKQAIVEYGKIISQNNSFNNRYYLGLVLLNQQEYAQVISIANELPIPNNFFEPLFTSRKDYLLASSYLLTKQCEKAKQYLDAYHNDISHKFIFDWYKKIPGIDEKEYMIYYLICEYNAQEAQLHLGNFLNDPQVSKVDKNNAQNLYIKLTGSIMY